MQFAIGSLNFGRLTSRTAGRFALSFRAEERREARATYRVPAVDGEYTSSGGLGRRRIVCRVRIVAASAAACYAECDAIHDALAGQALTIAGPSGATFARCRLDHARPQGDPAATGWPQVTAFADLELHFTCYGS